MPTLTKIGSSLIGSIQPFGGTSLPFGFLFCDGSSLLRTTYPKLFASIGTSYGAVDGTHFNIPDFRGRFLRGVDGGVARDPDRASRTVSNSGGSSGDSVGSLQQDEFTSHSHTILALANVAPVAGPNNSPNTQSGLNQPTGSTGGNETRPKNVYVNYVIKY